MNAHAQPDCDLHDIPAGPTALSLCPSPAGAPGDAAPAAGSVSDAVLDALAAELGGSRRRALLALAIEWGERILTVVYGGDIGRMRARGGDKDASLRGLAERLDVSAARLHHAVQIHDFVRRHPQMGRLDGLTVTHFRCVVPLPDARRIELLQAAAREGWTTQELERHARQIKKSITGGRGGRPRLPDGIKLLNSMHKYAERPETMSGIDDFSRLSPKQARRLSQTLDVMLDRLGHARSALARHLEQVG